jgi:lysozyme family protein
MADINVFVPKILQEEGGFVDNKDDIGGATMKGVTLAVFRAYYGADKTVDDLKAITPEQWMHITKSEYWDKVQGDKINNQQVADALFDWAYNTNPVIAIKHTQMIVGIDPPTGFFGDLTLGKVNAADAATLCNAICDARQTFVENYAKAHPEENKFLEGWTNRINGLRYKNAA